jgi:hypothetical protein
MQYPSFFRMRFLFKITVLLVCATGGNTSEAGGDRHDDVTVSSASRRTASVVGRRIDFGSHPTGPEPLEPIPEIPGAAAHSRALPMSPPLERVATPARARCAEEAAPCSPPEGTRVNTGSAASSPSTPGAKRASEGHGTPPRRPRARSSALEDTPDRPSLYGQYEASSDVVPMMDEVPERIAQTRVGYFYQDKLLIGLDRKTRELALMQVSQDIENYQSSPQQMYSFEIVSAPFMPVGRPHILRVGPVITTRAETSIMEIYGMPDKVIKYQSNGRTILATGSELHPLLREYWISKYVDEEGAKWMLAHDPESSQYQVSPRVFFVSPPSALLREKTSKTDFAMDSHSRLRSIRAGATVRFMIMERTGSNLEDFMSLHDESTHRVDFKLGMRILHQLISRLRVLHSINLIHGDVHMGNVVRALGGDRDQFLLIDYGMASFFDPARPLPEGRVNAPQDGSLFGSSLLTHWQMMGFEKSFRDDVLRAMMTVGRTINGVPYIQLVQEVEQSPRGLESLADYFGRGNLFTTPGPEDFDPVDEVPGLSEEARAVIREKLGEMLGHVRGIDSVNAKPDHDLLLGIINHIQTLL